MSESPSAGYSSSELDAFWMPFTANRGFKRCSRIVVAAEGAYFRDSVGRRIFDSLSGLWCCGLGHGHPGITEAVQRQAAILDYAPSFQLGHPLAFKLARQLRALAPEDLSYVFFTGSGSESADTALKIARAYWRHKGRGAKTKLIGRQKAYHGVNFGGTSVGGMTGNRKVFGGGPEVDHLTHTLRTSNTFTRGLPEHGAELADELLDLIALHDASNIAAVIVEPYSGSAGVILPPRGYLQRLREICTQHEILLIFDEVITAFGRTGTMFAAEAFGVVPDMLMIAKQLTNGAVPMGAVIVKEAIYRSFMETAGPDYLLELPHGYTCSAHPLACAAALATLEAIESEGILSRVGQLAPFFERCVHQLKGLRHVIDIRNYGLAAALTLEARADEPARRPYDVAMRCWERGFYVRYSGDTIQLAPPFIAERHQIEAVASAIGDALGSVD